MEMLKDIFVPYKIAVQLKEIGFDEPCIGYYEKDNPNVRLNEKTGAIKHNGLLIYISAPTWEQIFKWFRNKNIIFEILPVVSIVNKNIKRYIFCIYDLREEAQTIKQDNIGCKIYEQAQEQLIYNLIEIYKQ